MDVMDKMAHTSKIIANPAWDGVELRKSNLFLERKTVGVTLRNYDVITIKQ